MRASNRPHLMTAPIGGWPAGTRFATMNCTAPTHIYPERHPVAVLPNGDVIAPFRGRREANIMATVTHDRARLIAR